MVNKLVYDYLDNREYMKTLVNIQEAVREYTIKRDKLDSYYKKRDEIQKKMYDYLIDGMNPEKRGFSPDDPEIYKYYYNVHFRIPIEGTSSLMGFFFDVTKNTWMSEPINIRIDDYDRYYHFFPGSTGHKNCFLVIDYAEEIISKCKDRMRLTKYNSEYDLSLLIDTLYSLSEMRGDKYLVREGTPPAKVAPGIDRMTGEEKKVRGSANKLSVGFKIVNVDME